MVRVIHVVAPDVVIVMSEWRRLHFGLVTDFFEYCIMYISDGFGSQVWPLFFLLSGDARGCCICFNLMILLNSYLSFGFVRFWVPQQGPGQDREIAAMHYLFTV